MRAPLTPNRSLNRDASPIMYCHPKQTCRPVADSASGTLGALVRLYRIHNRPGAVEELDFFRRMPSSELAVHQAALATDHRGKRYSHQCRIPLASLRRARQILVPLAVHFEKCKSFHQLHSLIVDKLRGIGGLGELYYYDTALRLGAYLQLSPQFVYLHSGTRTGARALGLNTSGSHIEPTRLPQEIQALAPHEAEDFLCIYKHRFSRREG